MGVTATDIKILEDLIRLYQPRRVIDLGAQNNFSSGKLPAPYMSEWWWAKNAQYDCIDLNGENGAHRIDLAIEMPQWRVNTLRKWVWII